MKRLVIIITLSIVFLMASMPKAKADASCEIIYNGTKIQTVPYVENGISFLPLRDILTLFYIDVHWDNAAKTATADICKERVILQLNQRFATMVYSDGSRREQQLDAAPLVKNSRIYLPLRFIGGLCEAKVNWNQSINQIEINFPLSYKNNQWLYFDGKEVPINEQLVNCVKSGDVFYMAIRRGEPVLGSDYLWALYPDGQAERIFNDQIWDFKIEDGYCYYLSLEKTFGTTLSVHRVNLETKERLTLGNPDFWYNRSFSLEKTSAGFINYREKEAAMDWELKEDGIYIAGFAKKALGPDADGLDSLELMEATYGLYRLDKEKAGQKLVRLLEIDWQK